ncbi:MAG: hypothetical protein M1834_004178 [Cirrosporium novae-zelandiae]|nr:MAG: hypothetical protein M1834_004178 [Cirrosporium novae-zelandiae]
MSVKMSNPQPISISALPGTTITINLQITTDNTASSGLSGSGISNNSFLDVKESELLFSNNPNFSRPLVKLPPSSPESGRITEYDSRLVHAVCPYELMSYDCPYERKSGCPWMLKLCQVLSPSKYSLQLEIKLTTPSSVELQEISTLSRFRLYGRPFIPFLSKRSDRSNGQPLLWEK